MDLHTLLLIKSLTLCWKLQSNNIARSEDESVLWSTISFETYGILGVILTDLLA